MIAAMSLMVIFIFSFTIVRVASVALKLTGMAEGQARFQALSALTGTGFTTSEAEMMVNYPIRRKIVAALMIVGNLGLVSFVSTLMISFMRTDAELGSIAMQIAWIAGGVGMLYFIMTNSYVDKVLCGMVSVLLKKYTLLGRRRFTRLLQIGGGVSIVEHQVAIDESQTIEELLGKYANLRALAVRNHDGNTIVDLDGSHVCVQGDSIVVIGNDDEHELLGHEHSTPAAQEIIDGDSNEIA